MMAFNAVKAGNSNAKRKQLSLGLEQARQIGDERLITALENAKNQYDQGNDAVGDLAMRQISSEYAPDLHERLFGKTGTDVEHTQAKIQEIQARVAQMPVESKQKFMELANKETELELKKQEFQAKNSPMALALQKEQQKLEKQKLQLELDSLDAPAPLTDADKNRISETSAATKESLARFQKSQNLLSQIGLIEGEGGVLTTIGDKFNDWFGNYDKGTEFRRKIDQFINSEVMVNLPPGPATDKDISLVRGGYPPKGATKEEVKNFLEAAQRVAKRSYQYNQAQTSYLSRNDSSPGDARRDITVMLGDKEIFIPEGSSLEREYTKMMTPEINYTPEQQADSEFLDN
jgi:hypothetical protein